MAQLQFAFWDGVGGYAEQDENMADVYDEHIRLAQRLEELGWHSYFVIEHQNSPVGRITAPTVFLTAVARATSQLRLGAMMWQLPFYHPLRLAQEVAMLDHLSRGRVEFGTGIGVHEHEFIRWGVDYYQRAAIAGEVLDVVKQAWTQDEVTYEGKYFQFDEALPQPKPYQKPYPPIWAAVHSDAAIEFAARNNYHVSQNLDTDDGRGPQVRPLPSHLAGVPPSRPDAARLPAAAGARGRDRREGPRGGASVPRFARRWRGARRRWSHCADTHRLGYAHPRHGTRQ